MDGAQPAFGDVFLEGAAGALDELADLRERQQVEGVKVGGGGGGAMRLDAVSSAFPLSSP